MSTNVEIYLNKFSFEIDAFSILISSFLIFENDTKSKQRIYMDGLIDMAHQCLIKCRVHIVKLSRMVLTYLDPLLTRHEFPCIQNKNFSTTLRKPYFLCNAQVNYTHNHLYNFDKWRI